jgi:hypothetical protein
MKTKTIFRKWKSNGDVIAIFPELPGTSAWDSCLSYEHVGQHGATSWAFVQARTTPAKTEEFEALFRELKEIGYDIQIVKRESRAMRENRWRNV